MACSPVFRSAITGAIFAAIGIIALSLGAAYPSVFCTAMCARGCNGKFDINEDGNMDCDRCFSVEGGGCTSVRVTKQVYAYYSVIVALGVTTLLLAVVISAIKIMFLKGKIKITSNKL